jgi:multidrug efflux pump
LIVSQMLTLYTTPVIYLALDQLRQKWTRKHRQAQPAAPAPRTRELATAGSH